MKTGLIILFCLLSLVGKGQVITTVAGGGDMGTIGDGGPATSADIYIPTAVSFDMFGNYYFTVSGSPRVRKVNPFGIISTAAGDGTGTYSPDGTVATNASLNGPLAVVSDSVGNLYIVEDRSRSVRRVDASTGIMTTVAGNGTSAYNGDNIPATSAGMAPARICLDRQGNLYISDYANNRVRKVSPSGIITTIAGTGSLGISGMGGPATNAAIQPSGLVVDDFGQVYISDNRPGQTRVCKIDASGNLILIAGDPSEFHFNGDWILAKSAFISPASMAIDKCGNLYIADANNNRIRKVDQNGLIYTVAGNGGLGYSGEGMIATDAALHGPYGITVDSSGNLFIADSYNYRIRKVTYPEACHQVTVRDVNLDEVLVYPTAINEVLHIDKATQSSYKIVNIVGTTMMEGSLKQGSNSIDVSRLPVGMYVVVVVDAGGGRKVSRLVKE